MRNFIKFTFAIFFLTFVVSSCKKDIFCGSAFQVCSISSCRTKATNYAFCSVACWDLHVPIERHRGDNVAAIEKRAPNQAEAEREVKRVIVESPSSVEGEILVVVSKVKKYIVEKSGMNTSADVMDALTERIKRICDRSIEEAKRQGRKTVMSRDIP